MPTRKLQNPEDFQGQKFYIGIDVHKKSWAVTVRSLNFVVAHFTQPPSTQALLNYLQSKFPGGEFYSAYEAGFSGTGIHESLCKLGIKNIVVHPGDIPRTDKEKKNKTDIHDSRAIAFYLEKGNLHSIFVMSGKQQEFRSLNMFVYDGKTFTVLKNKDGKAFYNVGSIIEDKKGNIWTTGGVDLNVWALSRYDAKSLYSKKPTVTEIMSGPPAFLGLLEANDGSIWFGSFGGVYRYDGKTTTDFKSKESQKATFSSFQK